MVNRLSTMVAFIDDFEVTATQREQLRKLAADLSKEVDPVVRVWFVEQVDRPEETSDAPIETVGIAASVPKTAASPEEDRRCLQGVARVLRTIADWTKEGPDIEVEWDQQLVGTIRAGTLDRGIADVLLGEWARHLDSLDK